MKKKFLFVLLFTFVIFFLGAEEQDNANINENLSFQELFENSSHNNHFFVISRAPSRGREPAQHRGAGCLRRKRPGRRTRRCCR